jgi:CubicO group peptidase (beta-lactamase class C family)
MRSIDNSMQQAVESGVFPGGVLLVAMDGEIKYQKAFGYADLFSRQKMTLQTVFDLASLTKPLATALAVMQLVQKGQLGLDEPLNALIPMPGKSPWGAVTLRQLLTHTAGFPPHRPYYFPLAKVPFQRRRSVLIDMVLSERPFYSPGRKMVYTDLGFMLLRHVVEAVSGQRMDHFLRDKIFDPLHIEDLFFVDCLKSLPQYDFAATELCPLRGLLLKGRVHDDNAWVSGGVDGQAGLFGSADAIYRLLLALFDFRPMDSEPTKRVFDRDILSQFIERDTVSQRSLGFDMVDNKDSSTGSHFSAAAVGHLGFTGTSFWFDPKTKIIVILLTNRIHPSRYNWEIKSFRPLIHNLIVKRLGQRATS